MLTIHSVRVAVRGGVVNSKAIAGRPAPALLTPRRAPDAYRKHGQAAGAAAAVAASLTRPAKHFRFSSNSGHRCSQHVTQWANGGLPHVAYGELSSYPTRQSKSEG